MRFKYFDNVVNINNNYAVFYSDFMMDCEYLNITSPLVKDKYFTYTPENGVEIFIDSNSSLPGNKEEVPLYQKFIDMADEFIMAQKARKLADYEKQQSLLDTDTRLRNAYLNAWPMYKQLEAFHDNANGKIDKIQQMNSDFANIKMAIINNI